MIERDVDILTSDGTMNSFITYPEEGGPFPVVLFLMDAPGKREELHDMGRRLASSGYYVVLPNLYYRQAPDFAYERDGRDRMFQLMSSLSNRMVCEDCRAIFDFLEGEEDARDGPAGCVGYCMSGPFAFAAAAAFPTRIAAAASLHGVALCTDAPDSPHLDAEKIRGELYFGCAEIDEWAPKQMIDDLDRHLASSGVRYRIEWYPGAQHGFVFPERQDMYHKPSAERHWERLLALYRRNLY